MGSLAKKVCYSRNSHGGIAKFSSLISSFLAGKITWFPLQTLSSSPQNRPKPFYPFSDSSPPQSPAGRRRCRCWSGSLLLLLSPPKIWAQTRKFGRFASPTKSSEITRILFCNFNPLDLTKLATLLDLIQVFMDKVGNFRRNYVWFDRNLSKWGFGSSSLM